MQVLGLSLRSTAAIVILTSFNLSACSPATRQTSAIPQTGLLQGQRFGKVLSHAYACSPCLYEADLDGSGEINVFPTSATGNVKPIARISGGSTQFRSPLGVAVDSSGNIYVVSTEVPYQNSVVVFTAGSKGDASPIGIIVGPATGLVAPSSIALDSSNNVYVGSANTGIVTVYAAGSSGNIAPIWTFPSEAISNDANAVALDAASNIYVTSAVNNAQPAVTVWPPGANGDVSPLSSIERHRLRGRRGWQHCTASDHYG